jgi:D-alanyl-D-alanine carboxypeptidase
VNETPRDFSAKVGRPRQELTSAHSKALSRLASRVERHSDNLIAARVELAAAIRDAYAEGASIRAIAEAVRLSRPRVHELLNRD